MRGHKVAIRYSKSLLDLAVLTKELDVAYNDIKLIDKTLTEVREVKLMLKSPIIKQDKKFKILSEIFNGKIGPLVMSFLEILTLKGREKILHSICGHFVELYKIHNNIISAELTTAIEMGEEEKDLLKQVINKLGSGKIELNENIDPNIIGGFVVRVGDKQIDESLSKKLFKYKQELTENPYIVNL